MFCVNIFVAKELPDALSAALSVAVPYGSVWLLYACEPAAHSHLTCVVVQFRHSASADRALGQMYFVPGRRAEPRLICPSHRRSVSAASGAVPAHVVARAPLPLGGFHPLHCPHPPPLIIHVIHNFSPQRLQPQQEHREEEEEETEEARRRREERERERDRELEELWEREREEREERERREREERVVRERREQQAGRDERERREQGERHGMEKREQEKREQEERERREREERDGEKRREQKEQKEREERQRKEQEEQKRMEQAEKERREQAEREERQRREQEEQERREREEQDGRQRREQEEREERVVRQRKEQKIKLTAFTKKARELLNNKQMCAAQAIRLLAETNEALSVEKCDDETLQLHANLWVRSSRVATREERAALRRLLPSPDHLKAARKRCAEMGNGVASPHRQKTDAAAPARRKKN